MVNEVCRYDVEGYYLYRFMKATHRGRVSYYDDGKLIGLIRDGEGAQFDRLLLGVYLPEDSSMAFVKFSPFRTRMPPFLYSLTSQNLGNGDKPVGSYLGFWAVMGGEILLNRDLRHVLSAPHIELNDRLKGIPFEKLNQIYFDQRFLMHMERSSSELRQKGVLTFC